MVERFEKFIYYSLDGCWYWLGALSESGYGNFKSESRSERAHRVSYRLYKGPIPDGLFACHKCDNPACVNPDHLFLGTLKENQEDMSRKGRAARGSKSGMAKLTESDIKQIRQLVCVDDVSRRVVASFFKVDRGHVDKIIRRQRWAHV